MFRKLICLLSLVLVLSVAVNASADLVAHWRFDDGSGNVAHDTSGNANDGTFAGDPQWVDGKISGALEFNGSSDYIEVPFSESLRVINQGDFSIAAWLRLNEIPSEYKVVFQQGDDASGGPGRTWLFVHQSNEIRSSLGGAPTGAGVGIEGGTWCHSVVVVTEGGTTDSVQLYVNGEAAGAPRQDSMEDSEGLFYIGAHKALGNIWDGLIDDIRIYNHALSEAEIRKLSVGPQASKPIPADGAIHEDTWANLTWTPGSDAVSHDVYVGDNFSNVNDATHGSETFRGNQAGAFLVVGFPGFPYPDGLVPGTTYYWRIDEINEADPNSPWKGPVWSFSIPPKTAYNPDPADGAEGVVLTATLKWTPGFGAKLHTVYFGDSFDDVSNATGGLPQGTATYDPSTLESEKVYYWRVDEFDAVATHKGDVWSFSTEGAVGNPNPANGATDVPMTAKLSWTSATNAVSHDLYLGTDKDAVRNATMASPEYKGNKASGSESYDPGKLAWQSDYYWRVDAVYNAGPVKGLVWNFTTADFLLVDDFESYNDIDPPDPGSNRIFESWIDGFGTTDNGALVGNDLPPYAEQTIVHGGSQAMVYRYDNNLKTSEAALTLVYPRDWTEEGVARLSLWFRGASANSAERMYVALNGNAIAYHDYPAVTQKAGWTKWVIDLQAFADHGVNLANVNTISIGIGTKGSPAAGGTGTMYFDDIRLIR